MRRVYNSNHNTHSHQIILPSILQQLSGLLLSLSLPIVISLFHLVRVVSHMWPCACLCSLQRNDSTFINHLDRTQVCTINTVNGVQCGKLFVSHGSTNLLCKLQFNDDRPKEEQHPHRGAQCTRALGVGALESLRGLGPCICRSMLSIC